MYLEICPCFWPNRNSHLKLGIIFSFENLLLENNHEEEKNSVWIVPLSLSVPHIYGAHVPQSTFRRTHICYNFMFIYVAAVR